MVIQEEQRTVLLRSEPPGRPQALSHWPWGALSCPLACGVSLPIYLWVPRGPGSVVGRPASWP